MSNELDRTSTFIKIRPTCDEDDNVGTTNERRMVGSLLVATLVLRSLLE